MNTMLNSFRVWRQLAPGLFPAFAAAVIALPTAFAQDTNLPLEVEIVSSIRALARPGTGPLPPGAQDIGKLFHEDSAKRAWLVQDLRGVLTNTNAPNGARRYAAYYLGVLNGVEAADSLAEQITNRVFPGGSMSRREAEWNAGASYALCRIGVPAVQPLIRNVAEKDDPEVTRASLQTIWRIEGDKDVVQLRLQKALNAETDPQKQSRLRAALKWLADRSSPFN